MKRLVQLVPQGRVVGVGVAAGRGVAGPGRGTGAQGLARPVVQIGTFFNGQTVTVSGTIPAGAQAVLEVVGTSADEHLMRKGRRGPFVDERGRNQGRRTPPPSTWS